MAKLGDLFTITSGGTPSTKNKDYYENGTIAWIKTGDLKSKYISENVDHITQLGLENSSAKIFPINTVLVAMYGATIGACSILPFEASTNQACAAFLPSKDVSAEYLYYFLSAKKDEFIRSGVGGAQPNISAGYLKNVVFEVKPIETQRQIAANLDKVTHTIDLCNAILEKLDMLVKSRFVEMFECGYEEDSLLHLCNIIDYRGKTPEKVENGLPFITAKNIKMHQFSLEPQEFISKETYDKVMVRGFPQEGDVVFTTEAPLGNVCRLPHFDTEFYVGQRIVTLQTELLKPIYLEYALDTDAFKEKIAQKSSGSTVTGIRVRLLEQLTIPVPPLELQEQFAAFVEQTDKSKSAVKQVLEKAETLKKALMQEYFV
jgi:type I restriction enzyme S subunit